TATIAIVLVKILGLPESLTIPLMVLFGFGFCVTAFIGYKGLDLLSRVAVPAMLVLLVASLWIATRDIGGMAGLLAVQPKESMSLSMAITLVFGTFVSGATQATNWTRFAKSGRVAVLASLFGFFIGNGLMIIAGAYGAIVYQQPDVVEVLVLQGLSMAAVIMLFLNLWTTQDNTIYNFAAAGCNLLRTGKRKTVTLAGAAIGTLLAIGGMYEMLIPFLILLGSIIPPIGGVIMADFFYGHRARYPKLADVRLPTFNWVGLGAYLIGALSAYFSPWVAPLVGIAVAAVAYVVLFELNRALVGRQQVAGA
ncbi:MAG: cytosine permease, partial [Ectopseudomonas oleovorans]